MPSTKRVAHSQAPKSKHLDKRQVIAPSTTSTPKTKTKRKRKRKARTEVSSSESDSDSSSSSSSESEDEDESNKNDLNKDITTPAATKKVLKSSGDSRRTDGEDVNMKDVDNPESSSDSASASSASDSSSDNEDDDKDVEKKQSDTKPSKSKSLPTFEKSSPMPSPLQDLHPTPPTTAEEFEQWYMKRLTEEFGDDLNSLRQSQDFVPEKSVPMLIHLLKSGVSGFTEEEMEVVLNGEREKAKPS